MRTLSQAFIRQNADSGTYLLSLHADNERLEDRLSVDDLEEALASAEILEDYPDDPRGPSCLVLGYAGKQPVHAVCGLTRQEVVLVITVYRPAPPKWQDERTRAREKGRSNG